MKPILALIALGLSAGSVAAEPCLPGILELKAWSIAPIDPQINRLTVQLLSVADQPFRMVDATVGFRDALDGPIASYAADRDMRLAPGEAHTQEGRWGQFTFERLLDLGPDDVSAYVCVRSVLFADGVIAKANS